MILSVRQAIELEIPPHFTHNTGSKWGQTHDMPFGFIAGAIGAIGSAIGASVAGGVAAAAGIAAGTTAVTVASVTAIVGAVATVATIAGLGLTVIGLATGNKTLTKIGGYIGIAGGVAGIAAGAVSFAAGVGAEAASAGAGAAAVTTPLAEQAAAPVMTQIGTNIGTQTTAEAAKNAVVQASAQVVDKGSWFGNLFDDIGTGIASNYDKTVSALTGSAGTDSLAGAAAKVTNAPPIAPTPSTVTPPIAPAAGGAAKSSSFFGNLFSGDNLKNVLEIGKVGAGMIGGSAKQDMENQQLNTVMAQKYADLGQQQYQFNKNFAYKEQQDAIQKANKNSIANLDFETRQATPEEKDAYEKEKAQKSRAMAEALVTPAPLAPGAR